MNSIFSIRHQREYAFLLLPLIVSTLSQPLLGVVETAMAGRLQSPAHIAGVAVGTVIFNTMFWLLGFLRVGVTGFSAQARALGKPDEIWRSFAQPCLLAVLLGLVIIVLQGPLFQLAMLFLKLKADVCAVTHVYYQILVWAAPLVLVNYVVLGWLMGQGRMREIVIMQVGGNLLTILLDLLLVQGFGCGVAAIAGAACAGHVFALLCGLRFLLPLLPKNAASIGSIVQGAALWRMLRVNCDLLLRTACLLVQVNIFMASSSALGTLTLSANAILVQIMLCFSYLFEGIANASSIQAGMAIGKRDKASFHRVFGTTALWTAGSACCLSLLFVAVQSSVLPLFTSMPHVLAETAHYAAWGALFPLCAGWGLAFYGIFTGASLTRPVFWSTLLALGAFLLVWKVALPFWGNNGLWLAYMVFYLGRSLFLSAWWPSLWRLFDNYGERVARPANVTA